MLWIGPALAEDLYVAQTAAGAADGSNCANARAVTFFNTAGNWGAGANKISAGDTVYLCGTLTTALSAQGSGSVGNVITISPAPGTTATIDGQNVAGFTGINFTGKSYITLTGVTGDKVAGDTSYGLKIVNIAASAGTNAYCVYENNGGTFINVLHVECSGSSTASSDDNAGGLYLAIDSVTEIAYNWIHSTTAPTRWVVSGITAWAGPGSSTNFDDVKIHHNWVQDVGHDGIKCGSNCSMYNNVVTNVAGSGHSDSLLFQSGSYGAIYNNYVFGSGDQNIYLDNLYNSTCGHIRIYNNVINSNPGFGMNIHPEGGAGTAPASTGCTGSGASLWDDIVIANNTFYSTSASSIKTSTGGGQTTNLVILNNIFGTNTDGSYRNIDVKANTTWASSTAWDYNIYSTASVNYPTVAAWTANHTLAQLQALSPARETNGKAGVPTYVNAGAEDFHLAVGDTVARGAGVNLTGTYSFLTTDRDGVARPASGAWDAGAYMYASGGGSRPPVSSRPAVIDRHMVVDRPPALSHPGLP